MAVPFLLFLIPQVSLALLYLFIYALTSGHHGAFLAFLSAWVVAGVSQSP